ncbi:MAG: hypothetical protein M3251_00770 [Thermoproteota archaeon]|nr:hypothetical protein [Thermoproteota archaeon]MDQ3887784.1 hypothetical protein [Thermoproteota archaeon]
MLEQRVVQIGTHPMCFTIHPNVYVKKEHPNDEIRGANKDLRTRLMGIVTRRNLNPQLTKGDSTSISEIVEMLITNGVITTEEGKSRESADVITAIGDRVDRGEIITPVEFGNGIYTNAIEWFDTLLPDIER